MAAIRAICFDLDGTLYDLPRQKRRLWKWMLRHPIVLKVWQEETALLRGVRGNDLHGVVAQRVAQRCGITLEKAQAIIQKVVFEIYPATFSPQDLLPGLLELFAWIDDNEIPRSVVSDHPTDKKLHGLGQTEGWQCTIDCSDLGALKPLPDGLEKAARLMGVNPNEVLMIGDRDDTDGQMALHVGAPCLIRGTDWTTGSDLQQAIQKLVASS